MRTESDLTENVREVMAEAFGVDESDLPEEISQQDYSGWSSLADLTLLVASKRSSASAFPRVR